MSRKVLREVWTSVLGVTGLSLVSYAIRHLPEDDFWSGFWWTGGLYFGLYLFIEAMRRLRESRTFGDGDRP